MHVLFRSLNYTPTPYSYVSMRIHKQNNDSLKQHKRYLRLLTTISLILLVTQRHKVAIEMFCKIVYIGQFN